MQNNNFTFVQTAKTGGDCTAPYDIHFNRKMTVREFVSDVLTRNEWGCIGIFNPRHSSFRGYPCLWYRKDTFEDGKNFSNDILDKEIVKATSSGGWSRMDYILTLKEDK